MGRIFEYNFITLLKSIYIIVCTLYHVYICMMIEKNKKEFHFQQSCERQANAIIDHYEC